MQYSRTLEARAESLDPESGRFRLTLYTDGEASDGHILNIRGGQIPDRMPLFPNHDHSVERQLGSLFNPRKGAHAITFDGHIEQGGDGELADIRRDVTHMMAQGHVRQVSGMWDAEESDVVPRVNLPKDHPAFVDAGKVKGRKRWGLWFKKWRGKEGSIVGLGADEQATVRSDDEAVPEHVRTFWREFVAWEGEDEAQAALSTLFVNLGAAYREARHLGASMADVLNALGAEPEEAESLEKFRLEAGSLWLPAAVGHGLVARERAYGQALERLEPLLSEASALHTDAYQDLTPLDQEPDWTAETLRDLDTKAESPPPEPPEAPARSPEATPEPEAPRTVGDMTGEQLSAELARAAETVLRGVTGRVSRSRGTAHR